MYRCDDQGGPQPPKPTGWKEGDKPEDKSKEHEQKDKSAGEETKST